MPLAVLAFTFAAQTVRAHGQNSVQLSPDLKYVALTVHGEADCQYLYVVKLNPSNSTKGTLPVLRREAASHAMGLSTTPEPKGTVFHRMDVETFLWLPGRGHSLVYGEHAIYGEGVVALWNGARKPRVIASPKEDEALVYILTYSPSTRCLTYQVSYPNPYPRYTTKTRRLVIR